MSKAITLRQGLVEIGIKLLQVRVYGHDPNNYTASFFIFKDGEHGVISGLNGLDFYKNIVEIFKELRDVYAIVYVHGSVTKAHARLLKRYSQGFEVTFEPTQCEGRQMVWITARLLS